VTVAEATDRLEGTVFSPTGGIIRGAQEAAVFLRDLTTWVEFAGFDASRRPRVWVNW
jgi:hypothetical protein